MRNTASRVSHEIGKAVSIIGKETPKEVTKYVPQRLPPMSSYKDLLAIYGIRGRKQLSQNFLMRQNTIKKMITASQIKPGDIVFEIGPGPGNLTREILRKGPRELYVIEKDRRFLPMLEMLAEAALPGQMKIILGDARQVDLTRFIDPSLKTFWTASPPPIQFFGNLPFNVATPLFIGWLQQIHTRSGIFEFGRIPLSLTFQWEVSQRLSADILQYGRSRIACMTQLWCKVYRKLRIPGSHFWPKPEVDVGLIRIIPREKPLISREIPFKYVDKFVRNLFHIRRAYIKNSLHNLFPRRHGEELIRKICVEAGVSLDDTPIMLSNEEISKMIHIYWDIIKDKPDLADYDYLTRDREPKILRDLFSYNGIRINKNNKPQVRNKIIREPNSIEQ